MFSTNRMSMAAHCARVAVFAGRSASSLTPVMTPLFSAQLIASNAHTLTVSPSSKTPTPLPSVSGSPA